MIREPNSQYRNKHKLLGKHLRNLLDNGDISKNEFSKLLSLNVKMNDKKQQD